jgi:hypothetical protein
MKLVGRWEEVLILKSARSVLRKLKDIMADQGLSGPNITRRKQTSFHVESGLHCLL